MSRELTPEGFLSFLFTLPVFFLYLIILILDSVFMSLGEAGSSRHTWSARATRTPRERWHRCEYRHRKIIYITFPLSVLICFTF